MDKAAVLDQYALLTRELEVLYRDQAEQKAAEIQTVASEWNAAVELPITERNAAARHAAVFHQAELYKLDGEISGALARLRYLDHLLEHG